jgi:hypothetical protein
MLTILISSALASAPIASGNAKPIVQGNVEYVVSSSKPTDFKPGDEEINRSTSNFDLFWNLRDSGNYGAAYAMLTVGNKTEVRESEWTSGQRQAQSEVGADIERQLLRITWYPNPPSVDSKGLYVAIDFVARTRSGGFRCGYTILFEDGTNPAQVARVDTTQIPAELIVDGMPRSDLLPQLPCYLGPHIKTAFGKAE